ncbi:anhydro-N-acetylmuramic acid kinase [Aureivirga sp. CE67]|uniref:anhydro-N-acetylmuramic acid kinase n=1 Tax=Aureivirga sp. CE67 TaxID=1788983 RepID=UPI0018CBA7FE|nr:anhydro-N-acetylmuramic acid kinase [Aureivirga sp. CE67]
MTNKKIIHSIGMMSGTSLDGIDLVYVIWDIDDYSKFKIVASKAVDYSKEWKLRLQNAFHIATEEITKLHVDFGKLVGGEISEFIKEHSIENLDFIASHGHTIFHNPKEDYTLQIGCGYQISKITNTKVICDFRTQDVALGGQGAPLVPIGDALLFSNYDACINLGGFANISFDKNGERVAFDICAVNTVLNFYANKLGFAYDEDGKLARQGKFNKNLYNELNSLDFYRKQEPKSLGIEYVHAQVFPIIEKYNLNEKDVLRTYVEHVAFQLYLTISKSKSQNILITGGGTFNKFLLEKLSFYASLNFDIKNRELINYKEALIFAFLGLRRFENKINCLSSVTGAIKDHSSGQIIKV